MSLKNFIFKKFIFKKFIQKIYNTYLTFDIKQIPLEIKDTDKILLFAPHQDDETIGAGGTIAKYPKNFEIISITKGAKGIKNVTPEESMQIRQSEFKQAMKIAKVDKYKFLNIDENNIISSQEIFLKIDIKDYDYIFVPNILDPSRDHKTVSIMLNYMLKNKEHKKDVKIVFYEVWSALPLPNRFVDITSTFDIKIEMLKAHQSQMEVRNYFEASKGLSLYRGLIPNKQQAEAFLCLTVNEFQKMAESIY